MKKQTFIISFLVFILMLVIAVAAFGFMNRKKIKQYMLYEMLKEKSVSELTVEQKILLFHFYAERKDLTGMLELGASMMPDIRSMEKAERIYVASYLAKIMRVSGGSEHELALYSDFFEKDYPAIWHVFRASFFKYRKEFREADKEIALARTIAQDDNDLIASKMLDLVILEYSKINKKEE